MTENSKNDRKTVLAVAGLLALLTFVVFGGVLRNDFITLDDWHYVTHNPHVTPGLTLPGIGWAFSTGYESNWHPLTWLSHMLDCSVNGMNPAGHHATGLLFHMANVLLLFLVLQKMTRHLWRSAFVAALFAIHPLHVESVAWVAERKDVLSAFFWMLTMWAYVRYAESPLHSRYALVVLAFALGLMAKPVLVTLPFVLLLLDYWPLDRITTARKSRHWWIHRVREKVPLFVLAAASSIITLVVQRKGGSISTLDTVPVGIRISNGLVSYADYVGKMLWPRNLAVIYPHRFETLPHWLIAGSALFLVLVTAVVLIARKRRYLAVGWLWYLGTLIPMIGLVQVGSQAMADRYTYIPFIGLFILVSWGGAELLQALKWGRARPVLACIIIAILAVTAKVQVGYWKDAYVLFMHADKVTAHNYVANTELGFVLQSRGQLDEAARYYRKALDMIPTAEKSHVALGDILIRQGELDEAIKHFEAAIAAKPDYPAGHLALARALADKGKLGESSEHYMTAARLDPTDAEPYHGLGDNLTRQHKPVEAIAAYRKALMISPDDPTAHYKIAILLISKGDILSAKPELEQALRLSPSFPEAHYNLGVLLASQGDLDGAISHLARAVEIKPRYGRARERLAQAYYVKGDYAAAWKHVRLCREYGYTPDPEFIRALAEKMPESRQPRR